eukprot:Nk52_evm9s299 gene=Nk52_evmTU9s299
MAGVGKGIVARPGSGKKVTGRPGGSGKKITRSSESPSRRSPSRSPVKGRRHSPARKRIDPYDPLSDDDDEGSEGSADEGPSKRRLASPSKGLSPLKRTKAAFVKPKKSPKKNILKAPRTPKKLLSPLSRLDHRKKAAEYRPRGKGGNPFTEDEESALIDGFKEYENSPRKWVDILNDPKYRNKFKPCRTAVDLKDKYRNLFDRRMRTDLPPKKYMLLNEDHSPMKRPSGSEIVIGAGGGGRGFGKVRSPGDAARKAAKRKELYKGNKHECIIYLREISRQKGPDDDKKPTVPRIVKVYRGRKKLVPAPDIERFKRYKHINKTQVEYLRDEPLKYGRFALLKSHEEEEEGEEGDADEYYEDDEDE